MKIVVYSASSYSKLKLLIKSLLAYLYVLIPIGYFLVILHRLFSKRKKYKYEVAICLIFKNEAAYLKEWIEYHLLIGVDHFYLYNNFSDDDYHAVLNYYIDKDIVTLVEWPVKHGQVAAYNDCWKKTKNEVHWLCYIDADEFINLQADNSIKSFLSKYEMFPSVYLYWRIFGTSGYLHESLKYLMIERYVASWPCLCNVGKSIINNDYNSFISIWAHCSVASLFRYPLFGVDDRKIFVPFMCNVFDFCYVPKAYINHYWSKSRDFYIYKNTKKGSALAEYSEQIRQSSGRFMSHELKNSVHDYSIQRWLSLLKERMLL